MAKLMKYCKKCDVDVEGPFCPKCKSLTTTKIIIQEDTKGKTGDTFECTIWPGPNNSKGIRVGANRDRYFVKGISPTLYLDDISCKAKITEGFWNKCPEIRIALDENGNDFLEKWMQKYGLQPKNVAEKLRGKADVIIMTVIEPTRVFKVTVAEGSGRQ